MLYLCLCILLLTIVVIIHLIIFLRTGKTQTGQPPLEIIHKNLDRLEQAMKADFIVNRQETAANARDIREETALQLARTADINAQKLEALRTTIETKLHEFNVHISNDSRNGRKELQENLDLFKNELNSVLRHFGDRQRDHFSTLGEGLARQQENGAAQLQQMSGIIERSIKSLQDDNGVKLEKMRETVDEKLQKTLETRLTQSFDQVSKNLESVQKGLGEMQQLATGVGDLKRVLSNVKTRGVLGEFQLENILEQLLTPGQYGKNVKTKEGSNGLVEFAVKLPGREESNSTVWLPIDSKFPKEDFEQLSDAYEQGNAEAVDLCRKAFVKGIRKCAQDIAGKYLDPPNTTDFAILFLPFESLYAEVLRTPGLFESIQRECRITITGPTTLSALLNSLQMGFRTLAISRRSSEVWDLLGAVKTEFGKFGQVLDQTQKKLQEAGNIIDKASVRSRAIERKLKNVQELPAEDRLALIGEIPDMEEEEEEPE